LFVKINLFTAYVGLSMTVFAVCVVLLSLLASYYVNVTLELWPYYWYFKQRIYRTSAMQEKDSGVVQQV
jgi:hypothetical protein